MLRPLFTGLLLTALALTGCKRGPVPSSEDASTPLAVQTPPVAREAPPAFARAGLIAPTVVPGVQDTGEVDIATLRESVADPEVLTEEQLQKLV